MGERIWRASTARYVVALAWIFLAAAACNPDPRGRCESQADCRLGSVCNLEDHLCEAPEACSPACAAGTSCALGTCVAPGQPAVQIEIAQDALLSPSAALVQVAIVADSSVVLGALALTATSLDGGLFASGLVAQASADAGVELTSFAADAQGPANLLATLSYTNGTDAGLTLSSAAVPVRIDAVPPALTLSTESAADEVDGWFPRTLDGGIFVDALLDDTDAGSGPDGGTLTVSSCASDPSCQFAGALLGSISQGAGTYRFALPRTLGAAGSEGPVGFNVDGVDNAGNHVDQGGSVLIDDEAPQTASQVTVVNPALGTTGEDGQLWFPAGTSGVDVELALAASDDGVGLDPASFLLTINSADIDSGESPLVAGYLPTPLDGTVHFKLPTGRASQREGPLRFAITLADKLGHAAAPVSGQILIDDLAPTVSLAAVDYTSTISPARSAVCAASVTCGRGSAGAEDRALRDDLVTATFTVLDCGVGVDTGALPHAALTVNGQQSDFIYPSVLVGPGATGQCANGSANDQYVFTVQIDLGADAPALATDGNGLAQVLLSQVGFDSLGGEGFSPAANSAEPAAGGVLEVTRVRWSAALGGRATGAPALLPLDAGQPSGTPRELVVPVDGAASPGKPDALEVLDATGAMLDELQLTANDGGSYDRATGDVAVGSTGTLWIVGTPSSCDDGLATCTKLWVARRGGAAPLVEACPSETGAIGSLAVRDAADAGTVEAAVVGIVDGGAGETAGSFSASGAATGSSASLSCAHNADDTRLGVSAATGLSLAQGQLFVAHSAGFYSIGLEGDGSFDTSSTGAAFTDSSSGALKALPAAPAVLVASDLGSPYFAAVDSLGDPSEEGLREAVASTCDGVIAGVGSTLCWIPAAAPWSELPLSAAPVTHTPVFDASWLYTVDDDGTLQLSALVPSSGAIATLSAAAISGSQQVSPPVLLQGGSSGSSALLVQANGVVGFASVAPAASGAGSVLALTQALQVGAFEASVRPPTPVVDARGSGSIAYVVDGANCTNGASCGPASVWALQLDAAPVTASPTVWPRPGHDSCNSREAEGACP